MADEETLPVLELPRLSKDDLKEFVLGLVDGQIFTSAQIRDESLTGMVFMPLLLGGLSIPEEHKHLVPPWPEKPADLVLPAKPEPPAPEVPEQLLRDVDWGKIDPEVLDPYREGLAAHEAAVAEWEATVLHAWELACQSAELAHRAALAVHDEVVAAWEAECEKLRAAHDEVVAAYEAEHEKVAARSQQVHAHYFKDIGVVWEWLSKAGPRSINGYPIFFSCRLMHREDWEKARRAAQKEMDRRKELDLDLDVQDEPSRG